MKEFIIVHYVHDLKWLLPDPAEQFSNPYLAMGNTPVNGIDPNGEFFLGTLVTGVTEWVKAITETQVELYKTVFTDQTWDEFGAEFRETWSDFDPTNPNTNFNNAVKIDMGAFKSDPDKNFLGRYWQVMKRNHPWQATNTFLGKWQSHLNNMSGNVQRVEYFHGSTVVYNVGRSNGGSSVGGYINISQYDRSGNAQQTNYGNALLLHEYGHYLQEQAFGPLTLFSGLNSGLSTVGDNASGRPFNTVGSHDQAWFEQDANARARNYFQKKESFRNNEVNPNTSAVQNFDRLFPDQRKSGRFWWYMPPLTPFHIFYTAFINTGP